MNNIATGSSTTLFGAFSLSSSDNCILRNNEAYNNENGFVLDGSDHCVLTYNTADSNSNDGFCLNYVVNGTFTTNTASNNHRYGIYLENNSENNTLYLNQLSGNGESNARDDGNSNFWDDGISTDNYWSDYNGSGTYLISGSAGSVDNYPFRLVSATTSTTSTITTTDTPTITSENGDNTLILTLVGAGIAVVVLMIIVFLKKRGT